MIIGRALLRRHNQDIAMNTTEACSRPRAEWFVPYPTTIHLPWGETLEVEGIPFEGWGTMPGKWNYIVALTEDGRIAEYRSWEVIPQFS